MTRRNSFNRHHEPQPPTAFVVTNERRSLTKCRLKNLLVITWGMLLPICPTLLYTLQLTSNSPNPTNDDNTTSSPWTNTPSAGPVAIDSVMMDSTGISWQEYLKNSVKQTMEGNDVELEMIGDRYRESIDYFRRWIESHNRGQEEHLRLKCINDNKLCTYWAAVGECRVNPIWMEEHCLLACQRCDMLIDEEF